MYSIQVTTTAWNRMTISHCSITKTRIHSNCDTELRHLNLTDHLWNHMNLVHYERSQTSTWWQLNINLQSIYGCRLWYRIIAGVSPTGNHSFCPSMSANFSRVNEVASIYETKQCTSTLLRNNVRHIIQVVHLTSTFTWNVFIEKHDTSHKHTSCDQLWNEFDLYEVHGGHKTGNVDK